MAAAGEADDRHTRRLAALNAGDTVLDDDAAVRLRAHRLGGVEEEVGRRLAIGDHAGAEHVLPQAIVQLGDHQRAMDAVRAAAGGDAAADVEAVDCLMDPGDRAQLALQGAELAGVQCVEEVVRQGAAHIPLNDLDHGGIAQAQEPFLDASRVYGIPGLPERLGGATATDLLAVDQHTVAVKEHKIEIGRHRRHSSDSQRIQSPPTTPAVWASPSSLSRPAKSRGEAGDVRSGLRCGCW